MPHYGERGRIAEEIIKSVLEKTLPKRFSIGTSVILKGQQNFNVYPMDLDAYLVTADGGAS